jgi:hypothetical protein
MTTPTLASAEQVVVTWLTGLSAASSLTNVATRLNPKAAYPQARITRTGGTVNEDPWYDNPRVQVEFWGSSSQDTVTVTDAQVDQLARDVVAQVPYGLRGQIGSGYVTNALVSLGPFPSPDPTTNRYRQIIEITLEVEHA